MHNKVILAAALGAALAAPAAAETYNYATFVPPASSNNTLALEPAFAKIAEESGGAIDFKLFAGGQLLGGREMLAGLRDGIADAGFVAPNYFISELPSAAMLPDMMPFGGDPVAVAGAMLETMFFDCPACMEDYTKNNLVYLGGQVPTPYRLLCSGEIDGSADAVKGLRMRGGGTAMSRTSEALGGIAVSMTAGDMYEAMERGQLDCIVGPTAWLKQYSLAEVVKTVVEEPLGVVAGLGLVTFNRQSWDDLGAEGQQMVLRQMPFIVAQSTVTGYMGDDDRAREMAINDHGVSFVTGDESMKSALAMANDKARDIILSEAAERGVENAEAIMDAYVANLEKWRKISDEQVKGEAAVLEQVLWDEIYSKVSF
ncbi:C4-dicarboxylate TRAP transporter substrate-binding protein [Mesobacterium pallidum]|uniref:C4-dicarboxylate TRAP transporter substrate-binding protein n=1 Tax=Mesobacterium pallidum TaxID=2872037 RepID=UPI001EE33CED|nr:C4-dicarboxylate TRAP transporter substrate-binding protein [Mesobacterium pallidum]